MKKFDVIFLEEAKRFLDELNPKLREKVLYNIWKAREIQDATLFKKLSDDIWEFRTAYSSNRIRLLAFWDKGDKKNALVIASHGFFKKSKKTPKQEIEKAKAMMKLYFKQKKEI